MPKFFDTTAERRQAPRTKLVEIAYIGMGPENGGLVLDVSDGGLSFHAVAPVQPAETVHFLLSLRGHSRIEGAGEVVWTNEMKTVCGLKFTSLSSGAREHLANWTNQSQLPAAAREQLASSNPQFYPLEEIEENDPPASEAERADADAGTVAEPEPVFAICPAREVYLSEPAAASSLIGPLLSRILFGCLMAALTATAYVYGVHVGKSETGPAARSIEFSGARTETPAAAPAPATDSSDSAAEIPRPDAAISVTAAATPASIQANSTQDAATSIPNAAPSQPSGALVNASKSNDPAESPSRRPLTAAASANSSIVQAKQSSDAGKAELAAGLAYLNGDDGKRDIAKALQQLWKAVANGNAEAEIILADLYATGDGVAQNCEQAQVLLRTATKTGNAQAKVKLGELMTNGCQ
jgi:hypothetical protein